MIRTMQVFNFGRDVKGARAIRIRKDLDEYVVELIRVSEDGERFIDDDESYLADELEDAQDTAQRMYNFMLEANNII